MSRLSDVLGGSTDLVIYEFDQSESPVMTEPGPWGSAYDGYCAGLAMRWLSLRRENNDYGMDAYGRMLPDYLGSTMGQNVYNDTDYPTTLSKFGLGLASETIFEGPPNGSALADRVLGKRGLWLLGLRKGPNKSGHAIAIHSSKAFPSRVFDANYGQFKVPRDMSYLLARFFKNTRYEITYPEKTILREIT